MTSVLELGIDDYRERLDSQRGTFFAEFYTQPHLHRHREPVLLISLYIHVARFQLRDVDRLTNPQAERVSGLISKDVFSSPPLQVGGKGLSVHRIIS
jgi:hypothetical protein